MAAPTSEDVDLALGMNVFLQMTWAADDQPGSTQTPFDRFADHFSVLIADEQGQLRDAALQFMESRKRCWEQFDALKEVSNQKDTDRSEYLSACIDQALEIEEQSSKAIEDFRASFAPLLDVLGFPEDLQISFERGLEEEEDADGEILEWIRNRREEMKNLPGLNPAKVAAQAVVGVPQARTGVPGRAPVRVAEAVAPGMYRGKVAGELGFKAGRDRLANARKQRERDLERVTGQDGQIEPALGEGWQFEKVISEVSMSTATIWKRVDENGTIVERVVRKDTGFELQWYADARYWASGDGQDMLQAEKEPWEWNCHKTLGDLAESNYVVGLRNYAVDLETSSYRFYTAFCPHGSLSDVLEKRLADERLVGTDKLLPEPQLWQILFALAESGQLMERGCIEGAASDQWRQIVHRDLKPANIFLDLPNTTNPEYPVPRLADFGIAFKTTEDHGLNPWLWHFGSGTLGFRAPEQMQFWSDANGEYVDAFKLLAHTNVWGIGVIMWCLLHLDIYGVTGLNFLGPINEKPENYEPRIGEHLFERYSKALLECVQGCVRFDPARRLTFDEMKEKISSFANGSDPGDDKRKAREEVRKFLSSWAAK